MNRVFGIGQDVPVYNRNQTTYISETINPYPYNNIQTYYYPQAQHNPLHTQMYNTFGMLTGMDTTSYFMPINQEFFMYANQNVHQ